MRLHFIRHTRPDIARGVCYGQSDIPLAASFAEEAEDVRARLTERLEGRTPSRIYSSPLSRCRRLCEALGYEAPILVGGGLIAYLRKRIDGYTGDTCGALCLLSELATLTGFAILYRLGLGI